MEAKLIQIGNSKGVRFPKSMLQQVGITDRIRIEAEGGRIVITPSDVTRAGWEAAFTQGTTQLTQEDQEWLEADLSTEIGTET
jgi:antitoxin MazE